MEIFFIFPRRGLGKSHQFPIVFESGWGCLFRAGDDVRSLWFSKKRNE
jgi:hypothetical protein